ncbi:hypothetical protein F5Y16DRAFT_338756 [Xylariaceae sp. FL0255]|nr:hypothetical protein F5Y16DRAFT_338756 [Xylariaceae sp. FL0255]
MRFHEILLMATVPNVMAFSMNQNPVVAHSTGTFDITTSPLPETETSNHTEIIANMPPLTTAAVVEKPALEASLMGLIVFSAASLVLL